MGQGNVFTHVCHSVHRGVLPHTPPGRHFPWAETPGQALPLGRHSWEGTPDSPAECIVRYGQQAGGAHPTAMQSC